MNYGIKEHDTNVELVTKYMEWGSPMNQLFVIDALRKHAELVVEKQDELRETMKDSFIHPEAWIQSAKDWIQCHDIRDDVKSEENG